MMSRNIKIIIAGGRDFKNFEAVKVEVDSILKSYLGDNIDKSKIEIVSGGARGADKLAEIVAKELSIPNKVFNANWNKYGKSAGLIRNKQMANYVASSDCKGILLCFWDGQSKGTENMIQTAKNIGIEVKVVYY